MFNIYHDFVIVNVLPILSEDFSYEFSLPAEHVFKGVFLEWYAFSGSPDG